MGLKERKIFWIDFKENNGDYYQKRKECNVNKTIQNRIRQIKWDRGNKDKIIIGYL